MSAVTTYGGWVPDRPAATGIATSVVRVVGWVAAAGAVLAGVGTGGELSLELLTRHAEHALHHVAIAEIAEAELHRTPSENLLHIREVLRPGVSDLATTFGVSRQSIYNWLNGEPVAAENAAKLQDLASAADVLVREGVRVDAALLKRKFANGRTLLQVAQTGGSAREAALKLVQIHKREAAQRQRVNAHFAGRAKTPASADFDLSAPNDHV